MVWLFVVAFFWSAVIHFTGAYESTSDGCFRKFPNCIIVNAQPFERRSSVSVEQCQKYCLDANNGTYVCRSFVFNKHHLVCDLYAHTGNQYPAKLVQYYGTDYYEPTGQCGGGFSTPPPILTTPGPGSTISPPTATGCQPGQVVRYFQTTGMELSGFDDTVIPNIPVEQCIVACTSSVNPTNGQPLGYNCKSFDFIANSRECRLSKTNEAEQPNSLRQNTQSSYYQKICIPGTVAGNCPDTLFREPQKVLVGFAQEAVDAPSIEECLQNCINSQQLFGFRCLSGMYFYSENQLQCILNTESRTTKPQLYTDENRDVVDYFEGCSQNRQAAAQSRNRLAVNRFDELKASFASPNRPQIELSEDPQGRRPAFGEWTDWTPCDRKIEGRRVRYKICGADDLHDCPFESEWCNIDRSSNTRFKPENNGTSTSKFNQFKRFSAPTPNQTPICDEDVCCPYRGSCRIGLKRLTGGGQQWCSDPC